MSSARQAPRPSVDKQMQPAHADLLVGPQRRLERVAGVDAGQRLRDGARPSSVVRQPRTGDDARPVGRRVRRRHRPETFAPATSRIASANVRPPAAAVCSTARNCSSSRASLSRSSSTQRPRTKCRPSDAASSCLNLGGGQRLAVERHLHLKIEQRLRARARTAPCRRPSRSLADAADGSRATCPARARRRPPLRAAADPSGAETPRPASSAADDKSRRRPPSASATRTARPRAAPAAAATAAAPCWPRRRIRAAPGRAAGAAPSRAPTAASCTSRGTQTAPHRPSGSRRG